MKRAVIVILVLIMVAGLGWAGHTYYARWRLEQPLPADIDRHQNAIWMGHKWFGKTPPTEEIQATAQQLNRLGFKDIYFHVGPLDAKGEIPKWDHELWLQTLKQFRAQIPGMRAFAWVGGVTVNKFGKAPDTIDNALPEVRAGIVKTCQRVLKEGEFDGIHYDLERIDRGDLNFISLCQETHKAIAPKPLSVAASCSWNLGYLKAVSERCEQIAIMSYDLGMTTPEPYRVYLEKLVPLASAQIDADTCHLIIGVPTYPDSKPDHVASVENMENALLGIKSGLLKTSDHRPFQGVGIYSQWTTQEADWKTYERLWQP